MTDQFTTPERFRQELLGVLLACAAALPDPVPPADPPGAQRPAGTHIIVRRMAPALALAAILAAAALVLLRSGGVLRPPPATAANVLNASAAALGRDPESRTLGPGEYFYSKMAVRWRYAQFSPHPYLVRSLQEDWVARDGRGRSRYQVVALNGPGVNRSLPVTRSQDTEERRHEVRPFILSAVPEIQFSYSLLRGLPTDPTNLAGAIDRLARRYNADRLFRSETSAPPSASRSSVGWPSLRHPRGSAQRYFGFSPRRQGSVCSAEPATASAAPARRSPSTLRTPSSS